MVLFSNPLVSVIVPAYNAGKFIQQTLASILAQSYRNLEIIVVDDGSTDDTAEIVKSIAENDDRLILVSQSNRGVAMARNCGIEMSRGEYLAPVDADDIWYPQKIEKQVHSMLKHGPRTGLVYTWFNILDEEGCVTGRGREWTLEGSVYRALIYANFVGNGSTPMMRRSCIDQVGLYNPGLKAQGAEGCEDWDLYLRIARHYEYRVVPEYLVGYRKYAGNMSSNYLQMAKSQWIVLNEIKQKYPEIPAKIFRWVNAKSYFRQSLLTYKKGEYRQVLPLAGKTFSSDPWSLLSYQLLNVVARSLLKIATRPISRAPEGSFSSNGKTARPGIPQNHTNQTPPRRTQKPTFIKDYLNFYDRIYLKRLYSIIKE